MVTSVKSEWVVFGASLLVAVLILAFGHYGGGDKAPEEAYLDGVEALLPHRALYDMKMTSVRSGAQIVNVSGQLVFEWRPDCGGVVTDYHFDMHYEYSDSAPVDVKSHVANFEPYDRPHLDFATQRFNGGALFQSISGAADLSAGQVSYQKPEDAVTALPADTAFPTGYTLKLARAIDAGQTMMTAHLFDGSDEQGAVWVNTLIGAPVDALDGGFIGETVDPTALTSSPAHRVQMAFFSAGEGDSLPDYEMRAIFHQNGVMRSVEIEYDDFSVVQDLVSLDIIEGGCQ